MPIRNKMKMFTFILFIYILIFVFFIFLFNSALQQGIEIYSHSSQAQRNNTFDRLVCRMLSKILSLYRQPVLTRQPSRMPTLGHSNFGAFGIQAVKQTLHICIWLGRIYRSMKSVIHTVCQTRATRLSHVPFSCAQAANQIILYFLLHCIVS